MTVSIKPVDNYDVEAWNHYYNLHPGMNRSVGADGDDDEGTGDDDGDKAAAAAAAAKEAAEAAATAEAKKASAESWRNGLSEEIREDPNFTKYTSLESFAKGHLNAVSLLGKEAPELKVPDNEDERNAMFNKLGRPEEASGYKFTDMTEETPEALRDYVGTRIESFRETAHKMGLSASQASELHDWYMQGNIDSAKDLMSKADEGRKAEEVALRTEWGDGYEKQLNISKYALAEFADQNFIEYLEATKLGNNPHLIKAFNKIGSAMLGDDVLEDGETGDTPAQLDIQVKEIMSNKNYWDADSPERPGLVAKVQALMQKMHPEPSAR